MITGYIELQQKPILRRTRASTNKLFQEHKVELEEVKTKDNFDVATFRLNEKIYKVELISGEKILNVSCPDCIGKV